MELLDPFLRLLDLAGEEAPLDGLAVLHAHAGHDAGDELAVVAAHQVVIEGDEELAAAGIALAAGAASELVVDAAGIVALGADDVQAALLGHLAALLLHALLRLDLVDGALPDV
ncbi:MAG: hypothetical protein LW700_12590, partial [Gemmataceae bacterium]|nr:hypothetical protein [Gemmataceae bacterium]